MPTTGRRASKTINRPTAYCLRNSCDPKNRAALRIPYISATAAEHAINRSLSSRGQRGACVAAGLHPATGSGFIYPLNGGERRLATRQTYCPADGAVGREAQFRQ